MDRLIRVTTAAGALTCLMASIATAQTGILPDKRTFFTFSGPVSIPGVTLQAGTYLFRVPSPDTSSGVVEVLSKDGMTTYGMFFTRPTGRDDTPTAPEVRMMETAEKMPAAIRSWWYPWEGHGYELVYPREQAMLLAKGAKDPVLTTREPTSKVEETNTEDLTRVDAAGKDVPVSDDEEGVSAGSGGKAQKGEMAPADIKIKERSDKSER